MDLNLDLPSDYVDLPLVERQDYVNKLQKEVLELQKTLGGLRAGQTNNLVSAYKSKFFPYHKSTKWKNHKTLRASGDRILGTCVFHQGSTSEPAAATITQSGSAIAWDMASGMKFDAITVGKGNLMAISASPQGKILTVGGLSCTVDVFSLGDNLRQLTGDPDPPFNFLHTQKSSSVSEPQNSSYKYSLSGHYSAITALEFLDDSNVISASHDGGVNMWDLYDTRTLITLNEQTPINSVSCVDPYTFVTAAGSGETKVWDVRDNNSEAMSFSHNFAVKGCKVMPDSKSLLATDGKNMLLYDMRSNGLLETYSNNSGNVTSFCISPSGRLAFIGDDTGATHALDLIYRSNLAPMDLRKDIISGVNVTNNQLLVSSWDGSLKTFTGPH